MLPARKLFPTESTEKKVGFLPSWLGPASQGLGQKGPGGDAAVVGRLGPGRLDRQRGSGRPRTTAAGGHRV